MDANVRIPLTPEDRRRPEYAGGTPILLPDGLPWRFFEPRPVVRQVRGDEGEGERLIAWDFGGPDVDAETNDILGRGFHKILAKIDRATNDRDRASGHLEAAWFLLARNYGIEPEEFEDILLRGGRRASKDLRRAIRQFERLIGGVVGQVEPLLESLEAASLAGEESS